MATIVQYSREHECYVTMTIREAREGKRLELHDCNTIPGGYDLRCPSCWLGYAHTVAVHEGAIRKAERLASTRKPYSASTVTRRDFEHVIDAECRENPYM